jgi:hypothetical protein
MNHESVNEEIAHRYESVDRCQANRPFANTPQCSQTEYVKLRVNKKCGYYHMVNAEVNHFSHYHSLICMLLITAAAWSTAFNIFTWVWCRENV